MKWTLLVVLLGIATSNAAGQKYFEKSITKSPVNIPLDDVKRTYIAPPARFNQLKSAQSNQTNFEVTYINFPKEAKQAFEYALSIWGSLISTNVTINMRAEWKSIDGKVLALSRPSAFYKNFDGALLKNVYYPVTLVEKLNGENVNSGQPDIVCSFSNEYPWYFGTDGNTPANKYDFVTSVLHEITHGLGFSGFLKDDNNQGYFSNSNNCPSVYDYYIYNHLNQQISDNSIFRSPSSELHRQLTSENLKLNSPVVENSAQKAIGWIYAPGNWKEGSSIYHLDNSKSVNTNGLMHAYLYKGAAYHSPDEATLQILSEMGWGAPSIQFDELKDLEETTASIPLEVEITDNNSANLNVKVIFSTNYFASCDSATLKFDQNTKHFKGEMPVNFHLGRIQYYFKIEKTGSRTYTLPGTAPAKKFAIRIGPDYFAPEINHNPVKIASQSTNEIEFSAFAEDNLGIQNVKIEYKINGVSQEPLVLENETDNRFSGMINIAQFSGANKLEYRIIAEDSSSRKNKKTLPSNGFYTVHIFNPFEPVNGYVTNFKNCTSDFTLADFEISCEPGFSDDILHTLNPYPVSSVENEKTNLIAQLNYPVVVQPNGLMTFDEVVLVEPGQEGSNYSEGCFWDYVIVEGSKDNGKTWLPLTEGYDSGNDMNWVSSFNANLKSSTSGASAQEDMFVKRYVNLTQNSEFAAGDTVIFRFRLASDCTVNGWGWAIDNLEIQKLHTTTNNILAKNNIGVYPNPFSDSFYVDCQDNASTRAIDIIVTDLYGKIIHRETGINPFFSPKTRIDLANESPGIYLVSVTDESGKLTSNKVVKK